MNGRNNKDMLKEIAEAAGDGYDYYFQKAINYSGGEYGIGIVTNGTLSNKNSASLETGGYEGRCWQRAEVTVGGKVIAVYNTHLTWENQDVRMQQMRDVLTVMEEDETPYKVLTGDFNAQESNDEFDAFLREYTIANGKDGLWLDTYIPFDATMKTNAIDNIITTRNIKIKSVEAKEISDIGSDHRVLIATCELLDEEQPSTQLLDKQISKAEAMAGQTTVYTEESLAELSAAIEAAKNADTSSQDTVNAAVTALNDAMANVKRLPVERSTPVAYWDFDGDEPLKDKTGRGNDGVEGGTISFQPGLANLGNALCTKDGYVVVAKTTDDLNLGTEDFSVGFWYKASNPGEWSAVLGDKNWNSGGNPGMAIVQGQGQFYTSYAANGCARQENIVSGTASKVYDDKWHYIVAVLDRDDSSLLYVDGELIASTSIASTANNDATVSNPFYIGTDASTVYGIDSLIDDVKVYRNVLSPEEIIDEYELNRDQSAFTLEELIQKTETELSTLVIDPTQTTNMPTFESADGQYISRLYCSENDLTINDQGEILRQPLTDKKVQVSYIVQENKEGVSADDGTIVKNKWVTVKGKTTSGSNKLPEVVPTMQEWCGADGGSFTFNENSRIVVSANDMGTLQTAAEITKDDIQELFGVSLAIVTDEPKAGDLVLTFENGDEKLGEQGYSLEIGDYVTIRGTAYRGVFFGTRSLLQGMLSSGNNSIACGTSVDYPNYEIREFMLDLGR